MTPLARGRNAQLFQRADKQACAPRGGQGQPHMQPQGPAQASSGSGPRASASLDRHSQRVAATMARPCHSVSIAQRGRKAGVIPPCQPRPDDRSRHRPPSGRAPLPARGAGSTTDISGARRCSRPSDPGCMRRRQMPVGRVPRARHQESTTPQPSGDQTRPLAPGRWQRFQEGYCNAGPPAARSRIST